VLCKHEVVGSIPIGSTNLFEPQHHDDGTSASERVTHAFRKIIDIVKAGLAGSHNRLIHTTLKTDRINSHIRNERQGGDVPPDFLSGHGTIAERSSVKARASGGCLGTHRR